MIQAVTLVFYEHWYDTKILMIKAPLISETILIYYTVCVIYGILYIVAKKYKRKNTKAPSADKRAASILFPLSFINIQASIDTNNDGLRKRPNI